MIAFLLATLSVISWWICHTLSWYCFALLAAIYHGNKRAMTIGHAAGVSAFSLPLQYLLIYLLKHGVCV
jgi:hypothetical protein